MDTLKLAPGPSQYTFVADGTRYLVAALDPRPGAPPPTRASSWTMSLSR